MTLDIESGRAVERGVRAWLIDSIGDVLRLGNIGWRSVVGIKVFKVIDGIGDAQAIDGLCAADDPDVDGLRHGQAGRIPIGRQRIGGHGHAGAAHAHLSRPYDDKLGRERLPAQCQAHQRDGGSEDRMQSHDPAPSGRTPC